MSVFLMLIHKDTHSNMKPVCVILFFTRCLTHTFRNLFPKEMIKMSDVATCSTDDSTPV